MRIHKLSEEMINKIAADEVVERPASVVKELVENAIDAGATEIRIELEEGGRRRITVIDNGSGMTAEELPLAITRHATSKIRQADDLFCVASMGFRGEALAAVASVSKLEIITSVDPDGLQGHKLTFAADGSPQIYAWNARRGTTITIQDLFYNVPARLQFLKTPASEFAVSHELIQSLVLAQPQIGFTFLHNQKEILRAPAVGVETIATINENALRARVAQIYPEELVQQLVFVQRQDDRVALTALISPPGVERSTTKAMSLFVNGRYVKDQTIRYGILRGYHSHLMKGQYPVVIAHLRLDPSLVDVNVHPAKTEVRLQYGADVQTSLAIFVREALRQGAWAATPPEPAQPLAPESYASASPTWIPPASQRAPERMAESRSNYTSSTFPVYRPTPMSAPSPIPMPAPSRAIASEQPAIQWSELHYVGTYGRCYLMFETQNDLLVVDQHAFHERILYEKLCADEKLLSASQKLLVPEVIALAPTQVAALVARQGELKKAGFNFLAVDEQNIEIQTVPVLLTRADLPKLFAELADHDSDESQNTTAKVAHMMLATFACHAAVRAGEELTPEELQQLLRQAHTVNFYHNCPHGRRVFRWWPLREVASWFDRV